MKEKIINFMENLKKQNPKANWSNVFTGLAVLILVALFSYAYFNRSTDSSRDDFNANGSDETLRELIESAIPQEENGETEETVKTVVDESGTTVVMKGEGLWHVAQRVCGDAEKYNVLAEANNLKVWEPLREGMTLRVICDK